MKNGKIVETRREGKTEEWKMEKFRVSDYINSDISMQLPYKIHLGFTSTILNRFYESYCTKLEKSNRILQSNEAKLLLDTKQGIGLKSSKWSITSGQVQLKKRVLGETTCFTRWLC